MTKKNERREKKYKCLLVLANELKKKNWESYILLSTEKARDCKCIVGHIIWHLMPIVLFKWLLLHSVG